MYAGTEVPLNDSLLYGKLSEAGGLSLPCWKAAGCLQGSYEALFQSHLISRGKNKSRLVSGSSAVLALTCLQQHLLAMGAAPLLPVGRVGFPKGKAAGTCSHDAIGVSQRWIWPWVHASVNAHPCSWSKADVIYCSSQDPFSSRYRQYLSLALRQAAPLVWHESGHVVLSRCIYAFF